MNLKEKKILIDNMGNSNKANKFDATKRLSVPEYDINDRQNSKESNNFNFSTEYRRNISFNSNNNYLAMDKELLIEDVPRTIKGEGFTFRNNLDELRTKNYKSIENSDSRRKRLQSIKEIEKKLDDMNNSCNNLVTSNENKNSFFSRNSFVIPRNKYWTETTFSENFSGNLDIVNNSSENIMKNPLQLKKMEDDFLNIKSLNNSNISINRSDKNIIDLKLLIKQSVENVNDMNKKFSALDYSLNISNTNLRKKSANRKSLNNIDYHDRKFDEILHSLSVGPRPNIKIINDKGDNLKIFQNDHCYFNSFNNNNLISSDNQADKNFSKIQNNLTLVENNTNNKFISPADSMRSNTSNSEKLKLSQNYINFKNKTRENIDSNLNDNSINKSNQMTMDNINNTGNLQNTKNKIIDSNNRRISLDELNFSKSKEKLYIIDNLSLSQKISKIREKNINSIPNITIHKNDKIVNNFSDYKTPETKKLGTPLTNSIESSNKILNYSYLDGSFSEKNTFSIVENRANKNKNVTITITNEDNSNYDMKLSSINGFKNHGNNNYLATNLINNNTNYLNSESKNFEIIYEKEEEGFSKNPSALYDISKQHSTEDNKNLVSNYISEQNPILTNENICNFIGNCLANANKNNTKNIGNQNNINLNLNNIDLNTNYEKDNSNNQFFEENNKNLKNQNTNKETNRLSVSNVNINPFKNNSKSIEINTISNNINNILKSNTKVNNLQDSKTLIQSHMNQSNVNRHYSTEATESNFNPLNMTNLNNFINENINYSKEYSPKSMFSTSNIFADKTQTNLNNSGNDLALQSHRITESIKNIMNSNNIINYPEMGYYNTVSFLHTDDSVNNINGIRNKMDKDNAFNSENNCLTENKKISYKNSEEIPIVFTQNMMTLRDPKILNAKINGNTNINASKNILANKKTQYSQKNITKTDPKKNYLKEKTLTKNSKLTNSLSSIKPTKKDSKLFSINKPDQKLKINTYSTYQITEPSKVKKKEEIISKMPITSRNKNVSKLGSTNFNNTTSLNESNEALKKNLVNKLNIENVKKNLSRRNLSVTINPLKNTLNPVKKKITNNSFLVEKKLFSNKSKKCLCRCVCSKCSKKTSTLITEEPEDDINQVSPNPTNLFSHFKIFENLQAKNLLEFLFIFTDLFLIQTNPGNTSNFNIIQSFKNNSLINSKQIFSDFLRVLKSLIDNSINFNIDEETSNKNNVSNFSANSSFFNLSFERRRSELNRRRDERKNAKIIFIQKKWREYKLRKILKSTNIDFFANTKSDISSKCKNYILEIFMKNTKMRLILEYFNKSMLLWNEIFNKPKNNALKNSLIQAKQFELDNIINFDANSMLHTIASKTIMTHLIDREIIKQKEVNEKKPITASNKDSTINKNEKKSINLTTRNIKNNKYNTFVGTRK